MVDNRPEAHSLMRETVFDGSMSVAPHNLGCLLVMLMLVQEPGQAQIHRVLGANLPGQANALTVVWNPSPSPSVAGYAVYWGLSSDSCTNRIAVRSVTNVTLVGFRRNATYHLAVAAYDAAGEESPWSNRIQYSRTPQAIPSMAVTKLSPPQPIVPSGTNPVLRLTFMGQAGGNYRLQATEDFQHWDVLCTTNCEQQQLIVYDLPYSATIPQRFFRLLSE